MISIVTVSQTDGLDVVSACVVGSTTAWHCNSSQVGHYSTEQWAAKID